MQGNISVTNYQHVSVPRYVSANFDKKHQGVLLFHEKADPWSLFLFD